MQPPDDTSFVVGPAHEPHRYRVGAPHNVGGEGVVYRGVDLRTHAADEVAVKALYPGTTSQAHGDIDWRLQVEVLRTVNHPGVVAVRDGFVGGPIHQFGSEPEADEVGYVVMAWVEGETLDRLVSGPEDVDKIALLSALRPVVDAIDLINSGKVTGGVGLVHGDVKPENIIVTPEGHSVLVDFGLTGRPESRVPGVGTPGYRASPDADEGDRPDVYAMAGVVSFVLTGHGPADACDEFGRELLAGGIGQDATDLLVDARRSRGSSVTSALVWLDSVVGALERHEGEHGDDDPEAGFDAATSIDSLRVQQPADGPSTEGEARAGARGRGPLRSFTLVAVVLALVGLGVLLVTSQRRSGVAAPAPCPSSVAADWSALDVPASVTPGISWLDADGDCTHDFYDHAYGPSAPSSGSTDLASQHEAVLAVVLVATSVRGLDYGTCSAADWEQAAGEYVADTGLNVTWGDRDGDCLHDAYELNAVGLDPDVWDSDHDGVGDALDIGRAAGALAHAPDRQLDYLHELYLLDSTFPIPDSTVCRPDEWAAAADRWIAEQELDAAWTDPDGDCLDSNYERDVIETSPARADTDGDGVGDGTDPDSSNGTIEAIDVQLHPLGVSRLDRPGPRDGDTFEQPRSDGPD